MTLKLSEDQRQALRDRPNGPTSDDLMAIQAGIDDMEAGRVVPFEDVDSRMRQKLGLPARSSVPEE